MRLKSGETKQLKIEWEKFEWSGIIRVELMCCGVSCLAGDYFGVPLLLNFLVDLFEFKLDKSGSFACVAFYRNVEISTRGNVFGFNSWKLLIRKRHPFFYFFIFSLKTNCTLITKLTHVSTKNRVGPFPKLVFYQVFWSENIYLEFTSHCRANGAMINGLSLYSIQSM